jgi:hypothetical protein
MGRAFIWIRAESIVPDQATDGPSPAELANLFVGVPEELAPLARQGSSGAMAKRVSGLEILQRIAFASQRLPRLASWVRHHVEKVGFDYDRLASAGEPSRPT